MSESLPLTPRIPVLITGAAAGAPGEWKLRTGNAWSYQLSVAGTGAVTAAATIEVSNDGVTALPFGSLSASGTNSAGDGINGYAAYAYHRATITAITGTGAIATITAAGV